MLRKTVQVRIKIAAYFAIFLFAAALPASANSLAPVSYAVDVHGSSTQTLYFNNPPPTTQTFTGVTTYPNPPSAFSINAYTAGVVSSVASVHSSLSYPPIDPTISASASAGSFPSGFLMGDAVSTFLTTSVYGSLDYQYLFKVTGSLPNVPVILDLNGSITLSGSGNNLNNGDLYRSIATISVDDLKGNNLGATTIINADGNHPTNILFSKQLSIFTDTAYLVTLFVSAEASAFSSRQGSSSVIGAATAFAQIDPTLTFDPTSPNSDGASIQYSADLVTPLPSTWLMLLSGFVGFGFLAYRGTKKHTASIAA